MLVSEFLSKLTHQYYLEEQMKREAHCARCSQVDVTRTGLVCGRRARKASQAPSCGVAAAVGFNREGHG